MSKEHNLTHLFDSFDSFCLAVHASRRLSEVALVAANDGRQIIPCDRLSVAVRSGSRVRIVAVSGQEYVNQKSGAVRSLKVIATNTIRGEHSVSLAVQPLDTHADYFHKHILETAATDVVSVPMQIGHENATSTVGALIAENFKTDSPQISKETLEFLSDHVGLAISNSLTFERVFGLSLLLAIGTAFSWFKGRRLWAFCAILVLFIGLVVALFRVDGNFKVSTSGSLMPVVRQAIFAPHDGKVAEVYVEDGQHVSTGALLLRLSSTQIEAEILSTGSAVQETRQLLASIESRINMARDSGTSEADVTRLHGEMKKAEIELSATLGRLAIAESNMEELLLRSPIDGVVTTFQVAQLLNNRPVSRGEELLFVASTEEGWQAELRIRERHAGHVMTHVRDSPNLNVEYYLATEPERKLTGTISKLGSRIVLSEQHGAVLEAAVSPTELPNEENNSVHIGAQVHARIHCGDKPLGYVIFHDAVDFLGHYLWF